MGVCVVYAWDCICRKLAGMACRLLCCGPGRMPLLRLVDFVFSGGAHRFTADKRLYSPLLLASSSLFLGNGPGREFQINRASHVGVVEEIRPQIAVQIDTVHSAEDEPRYIWTDIMKINLESYQIVTHQSISNSGRFPRRDRYDPLRSEWCRYPAQQPWKPNVGIKTRDFRKLD